MATSPAFGHIFKNDRTTSTVAALPFDGGFTTHVMANNIVSFAAENDRSSTTSNLKHEKFSRKHRFQCTFCFGKACAREQWRKCQNPVIEGLHSNMIEDKMIGSQRPSTRKI